MVVVLGTNAGFVTTAPTSDPTGTESGIDTFAMAMKLIAPSNAVKITEMGWYCQNATQASNYDIGIYSHNETDNEPEARLAVATAAKGTTAGWKTAAIDVDLIPGNTYWLAIQVDDTATQTKMDFTSDAAVRKAILYPTQTTLPSPWGTSNEFASTLQIISVYVLYVTTKPEVKTNIGNTWKDTAEIQINIGDAWKDVIGIQINIGNTWKTVY